MLTLSNLKSTRISIELSRACLGSLTRISDKTLREIELNRIEPWLHEAIAIARVFGCPIHHLISAENLAESPSLRDGAMIQSDLRRWYRGDVLTLSSGFRLAYHFGLTDPAQFTASSLMRQVVDTLMYGERISDASRCAWCLADREEGHSLDCLASNLFAGGNGPLLGTVPGKMGARATTLRGGKRNTGGSMGRGLRSFRFKYHLRQEDVAKHMLISVAHYATLEKCERPLLFAHAERLANLFNIDQQTLYVEDTNVHIPSDRVSGSRRVPTLPPKAERRKAWELNLRRKQEAERAAQDNAQ